MVIIIVFIIMNLYAALNVVMVSVKIVWTRCIFEIKTELSYIYKIIKIYSIINKEVHGFVCTEKLKIPKKMKILLNLNECLA